MEPTSEQEYHFRTFGWCLLAIWLSAIIYITRDFWFPNAFRLPSAYTIRHPLVKDTTLAAAALLRRIAESKEWRNEQSETSLAVLANGDSAPVVNGFTFRQMEKGSLRLNWIYWNPL